MAPIVVIALLIGVPAVLIFLLKANAALVLLALCAGSVLAQFISGDATNIFSSFVPASGTVNSSIVQLGLLYAPAFFTILFTSKSINGAKIMLNTVVAVMAGIVGVLLALPLLPGGVRHNVLSSSVWPTIDQYQSAVVAAGVVISLFSLWFSKPKHGKDKKHK